MDDQQAPTENPTPPAEAQNTVPDSWEAVFDHPRFKQLVDRAKAAEGALEAAAQAAKEAEDAKMAEQAQWKDLADKRLLELNEAKAAQATAALATLRLKVGHAAGLPPELIERLRGDNEADMKKDAAELAKLVVPSGGLPPTPKPTDPPPVSDEERRRRSVQIRL